MDLNSNTEYFSRQYIFSSQIHSNVYNTDHAKNNVALVRELTFIKNRCLSRKPNEELFTEPHLLPIVRFMGP